jgi:hypothetical protein
MHPELSARVVCAAAGVRVKGLPMDTEGLVAAMVGGGA